MLRDFGSTTKPSGTSRCPKRAASVAGDSKASAQSGSSTSRRVGAASDGHSAAGTGPGGDSTGASAASASSRASRHQDVARTRMRAHALQPTIRDHRCAALLGQFTSPGCLPRRHCLSDRAALLYEFQQ